MNNAFGKVRIHKPDSCHGWGIEYNYNGTDDSEKDALEFCRLARKFLWSKPKAPSGEELFPGIWFHQSGSDSVTGYQFFEYWGAEEEEACKRALSYFANNGFAIEEQAENDRNT